MIILVDRQRIVRGSIVIEQNRRIIRRGRARFIVAVNQSQIGSGGINVADDRVTVLVNRYMGILPDAYRSSIVERLNTEIGSSKGCSAIYTVTVDEFEICRTGGSVYIADDRVTAFINRY